MKNKRKVLMESLERRVMLSITDLDISFGSGGSVRPLTGYSATPGSVPVMYGTGTGDIVVIAGKETQANSQTPPVFTDPIAVVSPKGRTLWTNEISLDNSQYPLATGPIAQLSDGSIVVGVAQTYGNSATFFFDKYGSRGNIVPSFTGNYGTRPGGADAEGGVFSLFPLFDGSFLTFYGNTGGVFEIQDVSSTGIVGSTFGSSGFDGSYYSQITGAVQQSDGKIVIGGYVEVGTNTFSQDLALQRFNSDGTLDRTFGTDGTVVTRSTVQPISMAEDAAGDLVVAADGYDQPAEIICFKPNGQVDAAFGQRGTITDPAGITSLTDLEMAANGSFYLAGYAGQQPAMAQITDYGVLLQSGVGTTAFAESLPGGSTSPLSITADGKLLTIDSSGDVLGAIGLSQTHAADTTPPTVTVSRLRRVPVNSPTYNIDVTYSDSGSGVDTQTIETGNLLLKVGPHVIYGRLVSQNSLGNGRVAAEYAFTAPSGEWNQNDVGTYTIETAADEVTDNAGNGVPLEVLGSFAIKAEKAAKAAAVVRMDMPMLAVTGATADWLKSDGEIL